MRKIVLFMLLAMGAAAFAEDEPSLIVSTNAGDSVVVVFLFKKSSTPTRRCTSCAKTAHRWRLP